MIDSYGREITYLRMSVTDRCNLRCRYCMPAESNHCGRSGNNANESVATGTGNFTCPREELLTEDEMIIAVRAAASIGITKLRITGGEPLVNPNIVSICERAAKVEGIDEICITTNGILLPKLAAKLVKAGVSRVNISLDTLNAGKYTEMTRGGSLDAALKGFHAALEAGFERVKVNSVLINGFNTDEIESLAGLTLKYPIDVRFIELMPMVEGSFGPEAYISGNVVLDRLPSLKKT